MHAVEHASVQFVVSTLVYPYPNDVFSVWVYILALVPNTKV